MTQPMPWYVPPEVADAPDETAGGFRYDADSFYTGELTVQLLEATPHAKKGEVHASSIKLVLGAEGPSGGVRWDEYLGLDFSKEYLLSQQKAFLQAFAPGYLGSEAHRRGDAVDLSQIWGRWALATVKKEIDTYEGRPPRHKPRVVRFLEAASGPRPVDLNAVKVAQVEIPQHGGGAARGPAPGARPPAAARPGAAAAPGSPAPGARPAPVPARPAPPVQQTFAPPLARGEDSDLPF